jgi:hypothetical protein
MSRKREYALQASEIVEHSELAGLENDDHPQYMAKDIARTITAIHTYDTDDAPFKIANDSIGVLVAGLNADLLDGEEASAFADAVHTHPKSDITDLETITTTPAASSVPKADGAGNIDKGWIDWEFIHPFLLMGA